MKRQVVITGIGLITSLGEGVERFWRGCLQGETRVEPIPDAWRTYSDYRSQLWSPLPEVDFGRYGINRVERLQNDPATLIGIAAATQALDQAGIELEVERAKRNTYRLSGVDSRRAAVAMGVGIGGISSLTSSYLQHALTKPKELLRATAAGFDGAEASLLAEVDDSLQAPRRPNPLSVPMAMPNAASSSLAIKFSLRGPCRTLCSACAAGTVALGHAFRSIRDGSTDLALAGGTELFDDPYGGVFRGFDLTGALVNGFDDAGSANRPFDRDRTGFLFSQGGAAVLALEELSHARRRGAQPLAEISGFAETCDAHNVMVMEPRGEEISRAIEEALEDARIRATEIDYVNAHGTGTLANDETEVSVLEGLFGHKPLVNSTKSLLGHTMGASGAIEAAVTALSMRDQTTHINRNLETPIGNLNFVRKRKSHSLCAAVSQSFAFGGHNAVLALRRAPSG